MVSWLKTLVPSLYVGSHLSGELRAQNRADTIIPLESTSPPMSTRPELGRFD